jgi:hypothetical protein
LVLYPGIASQLAEKLAFAFVFGWRSGSPLRQVDGFAQRL